MIKLYVLSLFLTAALALSAMPALASCPAHAMTAPDQVRLNADSVLIVTHASSNDDGRAVTKLGVDNAVYYARQKRIPVVYLQDERPAQNYFVEDCNPDYWVASEGGELRFEVTPSHVYTVGGHLEICLSSTLNEVLLSWSKQPRRNLTITYLMDGIFSNGKSLDESDRYYREYQRFMGIVTYNKPAGEYYQKLSLLETMGIIITEQLQYQYLERILPRYDRTMPADYRVELKLMDSRVKVLQPGRGSRPPVLRFEFIDSAITLDARDPFGSGML